MFSMEQAWTFTHLVELLYSPDEQWVAGGVFKVNIICEEEEKRTLICVESIHQHQASSPPESDRPFVIPVEATKCS